MSVNLGATNCQVCGGSVRLCGDLYTQRARMTEVEGKDAECSLCGAQYFAWIGKVNRRDRWNQWDFDHKGFYDLSYRASFNDEPGPGDVPDGTLQVFRVVYRDGVEVGREDISDTDF